MLYSYGLPFSEKLGENILKQIKRVEEDNKPSLIIIDGSCGSGKTTLMVELIDQVNKEFKQPVTDLKIKTHSQIGLGGKEFTKKFRLCRKELKHIIGYDEAGDFSRYGAISNFNGMINRLFETYRGFKILVIICLPNFSILDNRLFDNKIPRMLIHCENRTNKQGNFRVYSLSGMNWIRYWFDKLPKGSKHICYNKVDPNFRGHFLDLDYVRKTQLDKLSTFGKETFLGRAEIDLEGLVSYIDIAEKLNLSVKYTRDLVCNLKIPQKSVINKVKYFDKSAISHIIEFIQTTRDLKKEDKLISKGVV
jgi:hypothetical protein